MDVNLILTLVGLAIAVIGGVGGVILSLSSKISKLEGRLDTLASDNRLREQVDKIQSESILKLQKWATDLHSSTQAQLDHLIADVAQQQTQVHASLQRLKAQEASSLGAMEGRAQQLVQQIQEIEQRVQHIRTHLEAELTGLAAEITQQREQVNTKMEALNQQETSLLAEIADKLQQAKQIEQIMQDIEKEMKIFQQIGMPTRLANLEVKIERLQGIAYAPEKLWWSQLNGQWKAIFREAIGIKDESTKDEPGKISSLIKNYSEKKLASLESLWLTDSEPHQRKSFLKEMIGIKNEPTEDELMKIFNLTRLECSRKKLTNLEPLRALTHLQILDCSENQLSSLEALYGLKNLQKLSCGGNSSLSQEEIEHFEKSIPSCSVER